MVKHIVTKFDEATFEEVEAVAGRLEEVAVPSPEVRCAC
jgi:hypothetical protein